MIESGLILVYDPQVVPHCILEENNIFSINGFEDKDEKVYNEIDTDLIGESKMELINLLKEIENTQIQKIDDDYMVRVHLEDNSLYQYTPCRLAYSERKELQEIIDDLLKRKIIKLSTSEYSARIVPIRRKNGKLRICADLRPLNHRIFRQKYPFPIIEDYLTRLADKKVFTVLDLKDGFHQIKVHPDDTKYFSFVTPDGKYEYTRLPFGYSEAPAEFQKRILIIPDSFVRDNEVLIYMDDILIPSETEDQNLRTLKEVMLVLKQYGMEVNLSR